MPRLWTKIVISTGSPLFTDGIDLGEGRGKVFVITDVSFRNGFKNKLSGNKEDNYILSGAVNYIEDNPEKEVKFVTKDMNLRIKARALGLVAIDYNEGKIKLK